MDGNEMLNVHPLLCDRTRLSIMTALVASEDDLEFTAIRDRFNLTQGNLSSHLRKLEEAGLISIEKSFVGRKPRTSMRCTKEGRVALKEYLAEIEKVLKSSLGLEHS